MMNQPNPYSPPSAEAPTSSDAPTIQLEYFDIVESGFKCSVFSRAEVVEMLRAELVRFCTEIGYRVVEADAECRLTGTIVRFDQGSRFLRSLLPVILGVAKVHIVCHAMCGRELVREFDLYQRKGMGFQGGNSRSLLALSLRQIAMKISSDVGATTGQINREQSQSSARYLGGMMVVAGVAAAGIALLAYRWSMSVPVRFDGLQDSAKPWWACIIAVLIFVILLLLALVTAPTRVLKSRTLLPLRSASGVNSILAQRVVLALLALLPIGILVAAFAVL